VSANAPSAALAVRESLAVEADAAALHDYDEGRGAAAGATVRLRSARTTSRAGATNGTGSGRATGAAKGVVTATEARITIHVRRLIAATVAIAARASARWMVARDETTTGLVRESRIPSDACTVHPSELHDDARTVGSKRCVIGGGYPRTRVR
jgi:hypothetical protein